MLPFPSILCLTIIIYHLSILPEASSLAFRELPTLAKRFVSSAVLFTTLADPCYGTTQEFDFPNGHVRIDEPLVLTLPGHHHDTLRLVHPALVGYGGGGSVFAFDNQDEQDTTTTPPLIKVSWTASADSVRRECATLQYLESKGVTRAERCLGAVPYPHNDDDNNDDERVMIAVTPYVTDAVASVGELDNTAEFLQIKAVRQISQTLVQMLAHDIITIDVQPLISQNTGRHFH